MLSVARHSHNHDQAPACGRRALEISLGDPYLDNLRFQPAIPTRGTEVPSSPAPWLDDGTEPEPAA
jgi:hypothetical protein